jgi:hypothetical protein
MPSLFIASQIGDQHVSINHDQLCDAIHEKLIGAEVACIEISALHLQDNTGDPSSVNST